MAVPGFDSRASPQGVCGREGTAKNPVVGGAKGDREVEALFEGPGTSSGWEMQLGSNGYLVASPGNAGGERRKRRRRRRSWLPGRSRRCSCLLPPSLCPQEIRSWGRVFLFLVCHFHWQIHSPRLQPLHEAFPLVCISASWDTPGRRVKGSLQRAAIERTADGKWIECTPP